LSRVAKRYSKALFDTALEQAKLEVVADDLQMIAEVADKSSDFKGVLANPLIPAAKKTEIFNTLFSGKIDNLTRNFLQLISSKKRSEFLLEMISDYQQRLRDHKGMLTGEIISYRPLSATQVEDIHKRISQQTGKTVQLSEQVDESLVGGFVVKIKDTVIDLSVKNQLEKLRNKLVFG
jgi:F-type H+-transporting ATPase subunit delta